MDDEVKDPLEAMDEADAEDGEIDPDKLGPGLHIEGEDEVEPDTDGEAPTDIDDPLMFDPLLEDKKPKKEKKDEEEEEFPEDEEDADVDLVDDEFEDGEEW